ncbi:MAG: general secretion pathway protein GspK [Deltaproteobacteria bacterium]|nr:general secretion pathway protein GspK [Deltaproteobacteria bacterium]
MKKLFRDDRGFALILTILIISLIIALTLQFNTSMRFEMDSAVNLSEGIKLGCAARSGFNYALAVLYEDESSTDFDSLHEDWANSKYLTSDAASLLEKGRFVVRIIDHSGRINVNRLVGQDGNFDTKQKAFLKRFLESPEFELEEEEVGNIVNAIKDWIDPDDGVTEEEGYGAESTYYHGLSEPYSCRDASLKTLEELLLVKGITKEIFYGSDNNPGISNYLTIQGDGKININTAGPLILRSLSEQLTDEMVDEMNEFRGDEKNDLSTAGWYKTALGTDVDLIDSAMITVSSNSFEIRSTGSKGAMEKIVIAMVERKKGTLQVLSWKVE